MHTALGALAKSDPGLAKAYNESFDHEDRFVWQAFTDETQPAPDMAQYFTGGLAVYLVRTKQGPRLAGADYPFLYTDDTSPTPNVAIDAFGREYSKHYDDLTRGLRLRGGSQFLARYNESILDGAIRSLSAKNASLLGFFALYDYDESPGKVAHNSEFGIARALVEKSTIAISEAGLNGPPPKKGLLARMRSREEEGERDLGLEVAQHLMGSLLLPTEAVVSALRPARVGRRTANFAPRHVSANEPRPRPIRRDRHDR